MEPVTIELWGRLIDKYGPWVVVFGFFGLMLREVAKSFLPPLGAVIIRRQELEVEKLKKDIETSEATKQAVLQVPLVMASFEKSVQVSEERTRAEIAKTKSDIEQRVAGAVAEIKASIDDDRHERMSDKVERIARRSSLPDSDAPPEKTTRRDSVQ